MIQRATLAQPFANRGVSLFTAEPVMCSVRPAPAGIGLRFRRVDLPGKPEVPADIANLSARAPHPAFQKLPPRCTTLEVPPACVITTEHILAALSGMGVTDAVIEISAAELPILDGSARLFAQMIKAAGLEPLDADDAPDEIILTEPVEVRAGDASIVASPRSAPGCAYTYHLDYGVNPAIEPQSASFTTGEDFAATIAPARTFCLEAEAQALRAAGLFSHLTPADMLVLGPFGPIDNELRFDNEPARHKLLDLVGDLALLARPLRADVVATRSGHALTHALCRAIRQRTAPPA